MDQSLSIAATGLNAMRAAMAATSENIANTQTPGYVAESAQLSALPGGDTAGVGGGVQVTTIAQAKNALLAANNWQAQGSLANLSSLQQVLTGIENLFPLGNAAPTSSGGPVNNSLAGQLAAFWSQWDQVAADPSAAAPRAQLVAMAQGIVGTLHQTSAGLSDLATQTQTQLAQQVTQVNGLLTQAAQLNQSIVDQIGAGTNANQQQDQLNAVIGQLSKLADVNVRVQQDGTSTISVGGVSLVQGPEASTLAVTTTGGTTSVTVQPAGVTAPVSGGSIAGLLSAVNQNLPQVQSQLDAVASALATTVNTQLAAGYTATGVSGATAPLFTGGTASTIGVNPAVASDPSLLAAASVSTAAAANDGGNAQAMAELGTVPGAPDAAYRQLVADIGAVTQTVNSQVAAQTSVANQAQQSLSAVTGVNQDQQLTNLLQFQQTYQASAKLLTVVETAVQSLLSAV